jgi:molybdopterin-guanine dinucleotide biosynthesis protein A
MGRSKALLAFGPETMLQRVVRMALEALDPVVVIAARGQELPCLPPAVEVVRDRRTGRGPLEGVACGLATLAGRRETAFVTGCDAPLVTPAFIRLVVACLAGHDVAAPHVGGVTYPLPAAYRTALAERIEYLLAAGRGPRALVEASRTREVTAEELAVVDPDLDCLRNVNQPSDYRSVLERAGFQVPPDEAAGTG